MGCLCFFAAFRDGFETRRDESRRGRHECPRHMLAHIHSMTSRVSTLGAQTLSSHCPWPPTCGVSFFDAERLQEVLWKRIIEFILVNPDEHTSELQSPCNLVCRL